MDAKSGLLYIVATPIGNLGDITVRALEILKSVDYILCEDTRVTSHLLSHYEIKKSLISYHQHSEEKKVREIKELLEQGKNLALVTDAGTPGISDPGNMLVASIVNCHPELVSGSLETQVNVEKMLKQVQHDNSIIPIPGPSAVVTALSISGFPTDRFIFMGFPPHKKGRQTFFKEVANAEYTVAFYESCHRIKKCFKELAEVLKVDNPARRSVSEARVCVCRELTKKFESIYRGNIDEILNLDIPEKGEFVIIINKNNL